MRRALAIVAVFLTIAVLAAAGWWWVWTAPPAIDLGELETALAVVPADATGAVAAPLARGWMVRHPQALALVAIAAPPAWAELESLASPLGALAAAADGPLVAWWGPAGLAVATRIDPSYLEGLRNVAALSGRPWRERRQDDRVVMQIGTADSVLTAAEWARAPVLGRRVAALARLSGQTWKVEAGRSWLRAGWGSRPPLDELPASGMSRLASPDLGFLAGVAGMATIDSSVPAAAVFGRSSGWGLKVPAAEIERLLARAGAPPSGGSPQRWQSVFGTVWIEGTEAISIASDPATLAAMAALPLGLDQGSVAGADAAWLIRRAGAVLSRLPFVRVRRDAAERAAAIVGATDRVRWWVTGDGASVLVEW